jgi:hypothetical protein
MLSGSAAMDLPTIDLAPIDSIDLAPGIDLSILGSTEIGSAFAAASLTRTGNRQTADDCRSKRSQDQHFHLRSIIE